MLPFRIFHRFLHVARVFDINDTKILKTVSLQQQVILYEVKEIIENSYIACFGASWTLETMIFPANVVEQVKNLETNFSWCRLLKIIFNSFCLGERTNDRVQGQTIANEKKWKLKLNDARMKTTETKTWERWNAVSSFRDERNTEWMFSGGIWPVSGGVASQRGPILIWIGRDGNAAITAR